MTNLDSILKSRDIILSTNVCLVKAVVFPVVTHRLKCLPGMQETQVRSLDQEDPLEKGIAAHSSTLAWKILWTDESGRLRSVGSLSQTRLSDFNFIQNVSCLTPCLSLVLLAPSLWEKWTTEDEMVGWHHRLNRHGFG